MTTDEMLANLNELKRLNQVYIACVTRGDTKGAQECVDQMMQIKLYDVEESQ